jgi:hypothetical protein
LASAGIAQPSHARAVTTTSRQRFLRVRWAHVGAAWRRKAVSAQGGEEECLLQILIQEIGLYSRMILESQHQNLIIPSFPGGIEPRDPVRNVPFLEQNKLP